MADSYDEEEQMRLAKDADYIMAGWAPVPDKMIRSARNVKLIQKWGIGYDKIATKTARELNIPVAITAGSNAIPVAELTVGLMLCVYRKIPYVDRSLRTGRWLKTEMRGQSYMLYGKNIGLVGLGAIGKRVARIIKCFEPRLQYYDIVKVPPDEVKELDIEFRELEDLLVTSDIITIHVPLTPQTRGLIGKDQFLKMKRNAVIINTSRGGIIKEDDLAWALGEGIIAGAGLDVFETEPPASDNPLLRMDNVVLTSHIGGGVLDNVANVTRHAFNNMQKIILGQPLAKRDIVVSKIT
jgi:D-3-phosphoglycerate dehydrogenase